MTKWQLIELAMGLKYRLIFCNSGNIVDKYYVSFAEKTIYATMISPTQTWLPFWVGE